VAGAWRARDGRVAGGWRARGGRVAGAWREHGGREAGLRGASLSLSKYNNDFKSQDQK
jgi:hypothetical protein